MGGAEPPKFPKITPFCKGPPLPPYKNFRHGGGHGPPSPPSATGLLLKHQFTQQTQMTLEGIECVTLAVKKDLRSKR